MKKHRGMRSNGLVSVWKSTTMACLLMLAAAGHAQPETTKETEQEKTKFTELIREELAMLNRYPHQPEYVLWVQKSDCRLVLRIDDRPVTYNLAHDRWQKINFPIQDYLFGSGEHVVSLEVYPLTTQHVLSEDTSVRLSLYLFPEKEGDEGDRIAELYVHQDIGKKKLSVYRDSLRFEATLPFDHTDVLRTAKDLRQVPNLEHNVVAYYNKVRNMMIAGQYYEYNKMKLGSVWVNSDMLYWTEKDLESLYREPAEMFRFNCRVKDWEIAPIENYEMVLCGGGKIVYLRRQGTISEEVLQAAYKEMDGTEYISTHFIALYMPQGSDELVELY